MKNIFCLLTACLFWIVSESEAQIIDIDPGTTYQEIAGFGGFGPAKVWWSSGPWFDEEYLNQTMDNLGVTFFRTQIYWDAEPVNDNDDAQNIDWSQFDFGPNSDNGKQFPFIKRLGERGAKLLATVWTPPLWMKLYDDPERIPNNCYNCNNCPIEDPYPERRQMCGGRLNPAYYGEFAEYLVAYVKKVKEETGVDIYAINIQNEPLFANPFEANVMKPNEYADILEVVGSRFDQEGLETKFFGPEHMGEYTWVPGNKAYVNEILQDNSVKSHLDIYAVHSYTDGVAPDYGSAKGWTSLYQNISYLHGKPLWMTETSDGSKEGWDLAWEMSRSLHLALKFGHISGWVYWYMADVMIKDNQLTKLGYAFKNYYKYIPVGSVAVKSSSSDSDLLVTSFKTGDDYTIVIINNGSNQKEVSLNFSDNSAPEFFNLYRTSETEDCLYFGQKSNNNYSLPPESITTLTSMTFGPTGLGDGESSITPYFYYQGDSDTLEFGFWHAQNEILELKILDLHGKLVHDFKFHTQAGYNFLQKPLHLNESVYIVKMTGKYNYVTDKILVH